MSTKPTTAARLCAAVVGAFCGGLLLGGPAAAHPEGLTPYRYAAAPPGVTSAGPAASAVSIQPIGSFGFAGTTDNQMQLTLAAGVLPSRAGEQGVHVRLDQQDPASLPPLPAELEPEGNVYRVGLTYASSGDPVVHLEAPAPLDLTAPAAPTDVLQLVAERWQPVPYTAVAAEDGFSSVVMVQEGSATFLQVYDPRTTPPIGQPPAAAPEVAPAVVVSTREAPRSLLSISLVAAAAVLFLALLARRVAHTSTNGGPGRRRLRGPSRRHVVAVEACARCFPELQPMVLRCVGDTAVAQAVVEEVLRRAARWIDDAAMPPAVIRLELFRVTRDVLRERARGQWSPQHSSVPAVGDAGISPG
jgi:hypothetical protein